MIILLQMKITPLHYLSYHTPWHKWSGQGSLNMAKNDELLKWMKRSGCMVILIGYESMDPKNLKQMNKQWTMSMGERDALTEKSIAMASVFMRPLFWLRL